MRFTVSFCDQSGRQFRHFHSWRQAARFGQDHGEWIQDHLMHCEFHPSHSDPDKTLLMLSEVTEHQEVVVKSGGGGGYRKRLAVVAPGRHKAATTWCAVAGQQSWCSCYLQSWTGEPYHWKSHDSLRQSARDLGLPLYGRVLQDGRCAALSILKTGSFLAGLKAPLAVAAPAASLCAPVTFQTCAKCRGVKLANQITNGGLCYRCAYAQPIAPGIWEDVEGGVHFDVPALLTLFDIPDTPQNREEVIASVHRVLSRQVPGNLLQIRRGAGTAN